MAINRRHWLKQIGLGVAGIGLSDIRSYASPAISENYSDNTNNITETIILRSNENPYGPSPLAKKAFADNLNISNRYNWDIEEKVISAIALKNNVKDENILLGAGSTEILDLVAKYVSLTKGNYLIAEPSYVYWSATLDNLGLMKNKIPLTIDKKINLSAMSEAVNNETQLVYICNPNNPTGTICERGELVSFIKGIPLKTLVLVDEAYIEFTNQQSLCDLIYTHPNLIIAKTFSKIYGLAGARIGYAVAGKKMIDNLTGLQSNTNNSVSVLSKLAAIASLKDKNFISDCYTLNIEARNYTISELKKLNCECIVSHTNFIYFSLANFKKDYFKLLGDHNIQGTRIYEEDGKWTRITVGKMDEMKKFIQALM